MRTLRSVSLLALVSTALSAHAVVIDFEDLSGTSVVGNQAISYGSSFTTQGYVFSIVSGTSTGLYSPTSTTFPDFNYTGSTAIFADNVSRTSPVGVAFGRADGGAFNLGSLDLANVYNAGSGVGQGQTVTFVGTRADASTVTRSFTLAAGDALQTVSFAGFTNLTSVRFDQSYSYSQFDNVNVTSAVPGPMAALPFALMALRRRKRA